MDIVAFYAVIEKVLRQFFRHTFGQSGDECTLIALYAQLNFFHQVVYLVMAGAYFDDRVQQTCGTNHLFYDNTFGLHQLIVGGGGADVYYLFGHRFKFLKLQRAIIHGSGKPETVFYQVCLSGAVAAIHGTYLRNAHMAFVDDYEKILGEKIQQAVGTGACRTSVKIARIVFYA